MNLDVLIVGAGLAGASLAVALRRSRLRVGIVDARAPRRPAGWDNRIYAISPVNRSFLEELGVWEHLDASRLTPVHDMQVFGDAGGRLHFSAYDSGVAELAWIAESSHLHCELWETLKRQHNVTLFCPAAPRELVLDEDAARLVLEDGTELTARVVVAADGARSWVRRQAGIEVNRTAYDELGVVANFACEKAHRNTAYQWFGKQGVLAYLPLPGKRISIVWSAPEPFGRELLQYDADAFAAAVAGAGREALGALRLETQPVAFPLQLMRVERCVQHRLALIGDAAHSIHPLSGHGINLGFQDARVLAEQLTCLPAWRDPGELGVLRAYARARAEEPALMQCSTHLLNRLFSSPNPLLRRLRNHGMQLTGRLPVVKSALVRYAAYGKF